jgi:hypothetical protein
MKCAVIIILALGMTVMMASCQSFRDRDLIEQEIQAPFEPVSPLAQLHVDKAVYPGLFSARSYALWVGPEVTRQRREEAEKAGEKVAPATDVTAAEIDENFLVFECHIESVFEDMSIGYDVVGLRGIQMYLQAPDGRKISPAQVIMGTQLEEKPQGALKVFRRTSLVVFPKKELNLMVTLSEGEPPSARLVLDGYNSTFYFEWAPKLPPGSGSEPIISREMLQAAKMKYTEYYGKLTEFGHRFD